MIRPSLLLSMLVLASACAAPPDEVLDACGQPAEGPTFHDGEHTRSFVWTAKGSPHYVSTRGIDIHAGGKVVIEPCALVRFSDGGGINVGNESLPSEAELVAEGTPDMPIRFEPAGEVPWGRIFVQSPGVARLAWVTLVGGGAAGREGETIAVFGDRKLPSRPLLSVKNVTIKDSLGAGVRLSQGGAFISDSEALVVVGSGRDEYPYPIVTGELGLGSIPTGSYTGNKVDEILVRVEVVSAAIGFQENTTLRHRGVPYRVENAEQLRVGSSSDEPAPVVVSVEPGVTVKFEGPTALTIGATASGVSQLQAIGTEEAPVVFTSAAKDPVPGDWQGLRFEGRASSGNRLEHVRIAYTGASCACSLVTCNSNVERYEGALIFESQPAKAFLSNSTIAHAAGHAIVQGYDGNAFDWLTTNAFEEVALCRVTLPRADDTQCPDPMPECL